MNMKSLSSAIMSSTTLPPEDLYPLLECRHSDPHRILGLRVLGKETIARVFHPDALTVSILLENGTKHTLIKTHADGLFEGVIPGVQSSSPLSYRIVTTFADGSSHSGRDAYAFAPQLGDLDLYLLGEGNHLEAYRVMGAHPREVEGIQGTAFAVWAPNAQRVSVVGDFNGWDGRRHMMRQLGDRKSVV